MASPLTQGGRKHFDPAEGQGDRRGAAHSAGEQGLGLEKTEFAHSRRSEIFQNGEEVVFLTGTAEYKHRSGRRCKVVRALPSETGPMYRIRFDDGFEIAAYEFELARP